MKKRNLSAIIIASSVMMLTLAGCGVTAESDAGVSKGSEAEVSAEAKADAPEATEDEGDYTDGVIANKPSNPDAADLSFEYNGTTISITDAPDKIKSALGKPSNEEEAPNSDDPADRMYTYGTDPDTIDLTVIAGKTDAIIIYDSAIKTSRGISIGSTDKDVIAAYGEAEATKLDGINDIEYNFDGYTLTFFLDKNSKVDAIGFINEN